MDKSQKAVVAANSQPAPPSQTPIRISQKREQYLKFLERDPIAKEADVLQRLYINWPIHSGRAWRDKLDIESYARTYKTEFQALCFALTLKEVQAALASGGSASMMLTKLLREDYSKLTKITPLGFGPPRSLLTEEQASALAQGSGQDLRFPMREEWKGLFPSGSIGWLEEAVRANLYFQIASHYLSTNREFR